MKKTILLLLMTIAVIGCNTSRQWSVVSPDESVILNLNLDKEGVLSYEVKLSKDGEMITAIEPSMLGIVREDAVFKNGLSFVSEEIAEFSDSYSLVAGKKRNIKSKANEATYVFENADGVQMEIIFRVFNDGIGFKYHFPGETKEKHKISKELTEFNLPDLGTCWSQAYDTITKWTPAYETYYERSMPIGTKAPSDKNGWSFPTTFNTNDIWVMITESNLDGTYPACHLEDHCENGIYTIRFPEKEEAFGEYSRFPESYLPWSTPWRIVIAGPTPATIIESTLVTDLADPSKIKDTSWIKPGISAWSWWSDSPSPRYVKQQNRFTDLAVEMDWEYNLIDANWDQMVDGEVTDAIDYMVQRGIGPILWYNSGGAHNDVSEAPRDRMWDPDVRAAEFRKIADWGVKGVKVDFFQSDKQAIINQYLGILKDAADNKVEVNFHGCTLPRGWNRTWPNMLTCEAVPGGEVYKFGEKYPEIAPWHNTVLPFTRNAVGPMDYTPVMFSDHNQPHLTSYAHELATSVIFESGIIHMADKVEAYLSLPEQVKQFLKELPAAWDDVKFVDGYPGEFVILARRVGDTWYIAGLNGTKEAKDLKISTEFLHDGSYTLDLIADGESDQIFKFSEHKFQNGEQISVKTLPYGGFAGTAEAD